MFGTYSPWTYGSQFGIFHMMPDASAKTLFGNRVRELRKKLGWSQEEFAHHVGLDRSYIGGVERGERNISLENICQIAAALGVSPAVLFKGWPVIVLVPPDET